MANRARVRWRVELGARLRAEREDRGWSRSQLAARLRAAPGRDRLPEVRQLVDMVRQYERGDHAQGTDYRRRYCHVFGMDEPTLFGVTDRPVSPWLLGGDGGVDRERLAAVSARPALVDRGTVEALAAVLAGLRRLEDVVGSGPVLETVGPQLAVLTGLVAEARGAVRPELVDVAAQWFQYAGWLGIATGDSRGARGALDRAAEHAAEVNDRNLAGTVLSWRAYLAEQLRQVGPMIGLSQAAQRERVGPGRVYDLFQEARALALAGDERAAERRLNEGREAVTSIDAAGARPWEYYYLEPGFFTLETGLAYLYLGDHDRRWTESAVEHLAAGLDDLPAGMRGSEWAAEFRYQLGLAYIQGDEPGQLVRVALDLEADGKRLGSARLRDRAARLLEGGVARDEGA